MEIIQGGKVEDNDDKEETVILLNPWEYQPPFDLDTCNRIKDLARCAPKKAVKIAIFGSVDFTEDEQKEFDQYYAEGSAEGEVAIGVKLFGQAMAGDGKSITQYLELKAHWARGEGGEEDDEESGLNIFLSNGNKANTES